MEASLLPSKEIKDLCDRVSVAAIRMKDPQSDALSKELDVAAMKAWVVVLDGKGETLASFPADSVQASESFPALLAAKIDLRLKRTESVQELRRRWEKDPASADAFDALAARLKEMRGFRTLAEICEKAVADKGLPDTARDAARLRGYWARSFIQPVTVDGTAEVQFVEEGEALLDELAEHPLADQVVQRVHCRIYNGTFDGPGKSAASLDRLEKRAAKRKDPEALRKHIRTLSEGRTAWIDGMTKVYKELPQDSADEDLRGNYAVMLGDAEATLKIYDKEEYRNVPLYRQWVKEAREKTSSDP